MKEWSLGSIMEKPLTTVFTTEVTYKAPAAELKTELVRKTIHLLIALVPFFASVSVHATLILLGFGVIYYAWAEKLRYEGKSVFIISRLTDLSSRERDKGKFVMGPITLGMGAMAALFFYPEPAASIAIFALAFGDGFSSVVGKAVGGMQIPLTRGKTVSGSMTCFIVVFIITLFITALPGAALLIAVSATLFEALPLRDLDNLIIPIGTGFVAFFLLLL